MFVPRFLKRVYNTCSTICIHFGDYIVGLDVQEGAECMAAPTSTTLRALVCLRALRWVYDVWQGITECRWQEQERKGGGKKGRGVWLH